MNRKISICIFVLLGLAIITITAVVISKKENEPNDNVIEEATESTESYIETVKPLNQAKYLLKSVDGKIIVYASNGYDIYFETDLIEDDLPEDVKHQITSGIYIQNDKELYDFLESYSS